MQIEQNMQFVYSRNKYNIQAQIDFTLPELMEGAGLEEKKAACIVDFDRLL